MGRNILNNLAVGQHSMIHFNALNSKRQILKKVVGRYCSRRKTQNRISITQETMLMGWLPSSSRTKWHWREELKHAESEINQHREWVLRTCARFLLPSLTRFQPNRWLHWVVIIARNSVASIRSAISRPTIFGPPTCVLILTEGCSMREHHPTSSHYPVPPTTCDCVWIFEWFCLVIRLIYKYMRANMAMHDLPPRSVLTWWVIWHHTSSSSLWIIPKWGLQLRQPLSFWAGLSATFVRLEIYSNFALPAV